MKFEKLVVAKLLDVYPANAALVDDEGTILVVNRLWKEFGARNGLQAQRSCEDLNYLAECERAGTRGFPAGAVVHRGIREVLDGDAETFGFSYPCHSPAARQWFRLVVAPFCPSKNRRWAVLLHVNTTHQRDLATRYSRMSRGAGLVSVCAWCKLIHADSGSWIGFEEYFSKRGSFQFSHGICDKCSEAFIQEPFP